MKRVLPLAAALALASCATLTVSMPNAPSAPPSIPAGPLDFGGNWQRDAAAAVLTHFEQNVSSRYGAGLDLAAAAVDLRQNQFTCVANTDTTNRGHPPAQICRKTQVAGECTHTWQVHLFTAPDNDRLERARGLYDRRCAGEALLGGPG